MSDTTEPTPVAGTDEIEALRRQLAAATEKAERFAKQRDEARAEAKQAQEHTRRSGVVYRLRMAGVDEELADVLADRAPVEDDKLPEFVTRWQAKVAPPKAEPAKEPEAPKEPEPTKVETVVSPPRPGTQPTDPATDPMADLIKSVQSVAMQR